MTAKTWLAKTGLAGTALAMVMAVNTANAGELYVANLSGANFAPASGATYTGTSYFVLNNGNATGTAWFTHNIPSSVLTTGQIERANQSLIYRFDDLRSPSLTFPNVAVSGGRPHAPARRRRLYGFLHHQFSHGRHPRRLHPLYVRDPDGGGQPRSVRRRGHGE